MSGIVWNMITYDDEFYRVLIFKEEGCHNSGLLVEDSSKFDLWDLWFFISNYILFLVWNWREELVFIVKTGYFSIFSEIFHNCHCQTLLKRFGESSKIKIV